MFHYVNAITNTRGDALIGFYVQAVDATSGDVADIYADESLTPIVSVSGEDNKALVDSDGNASFYIVSGEYHLDIYATNATTFVRRIENVPMNSGADLSDSILMGLLGSYFPEAYGAVGDGVTDDSAAIQAAIDACVAVGGGTVQFGAGTYACSTQLTWSGAPVALIGEGASVQPSVGTILLFPTGLSGAVRIQNGASGLGAGSSVRNLRVKGSASVAVSDANAVLGLGCGIMLQANGCHIEDVVVQSFEGNGFYILSAPTISDNTINANNCEIDNLHCWDNLKNGFATYGVDSNRAYINKLDCTNSGQFGIYENSFLGNSYTSPHLANNTSGAIRIGAISRANVLWGVYKEADSSALALQMDAGGGGRNFIDLRQCEGTTGVPATVTITDNCATGDNVWLDRGYLQNLGKFGTSNSTVGTVTIDNSGIVHYKGVYSRFGSADAASNFDVYNSNGTILFYSDQAITGNFYASGAVTFQWNGSGVTIPSGKSLTLGGGTALTKAVVYTPSITPASVSAATVAEQTFTVSGLTTADKIIVNPPAISNATGVAGARVSAADTLAIRFVNPTAGALTPTSGTYTITAIRS